MITKEMKDFIKRIKLNKEYELDYANYHISDTKIPRVVGICGSDTYILSNNTECSKEEYENSDFYVDELELIKTMDLSHLGINKNDYQYLDECLEDFLEKVNGNSYVEGAIIQDKYVTSNDIIKECRPNHCKVVLREFIIEPDVDINTPIIFFQNNGGDYGSAEIEDVILDNNCYAKINGELSFRLYIYLKEKPKERIVINMLVEMMTCYE